MSVYVMASVFAADMGSPTRNSVMLAIADAASDDGSNSYQSRESIAKKANVTPRTVQRVCAELVEDGLITEAGRVPCRGGYTINYTVNLDALKTPKTEANPRQPVTPDTVSPLTATPVTPDGVSPEPSYNHPNTIYPNAGARKTDLPRRIFEAWNVQADRFGLAKVRLELKSPEREKDVLRRLAECGGDETLLFAAIINMTQNPFWVGRAEKIWRADFDWLFKSRTNLRKALEFTPAPQTTEISNDRPKPRYQNTADKLADADAQRREAYSGLLERRAEKRRLEQSSSG